MISYDLSEEKLLLSQDISEETVKRKDSGYIVMETAVLFRDQILSAVMMVGLSTLRNTLVCELSANCPIQTT